MNTDKKMIWYRVSGTFDYLLLAENADYAAEDAELDFEQLGLSITAITNVEEA